MDNDQLDIDHQIENQMMKQKLDQKVQEIAKKLERRKCHKDDGSWAADAVSCDANENDDLPNNPLLCQGGFDIALKIPAKYSCDCSTIPEFDGDEYEGYLKYESRTFHFEVHDPPTNTVIHLCSD